MDINESHYVGCRNGVTGGYRRVLGPRFRALMFRDAIMLAIVDLKDSIRIMGVEWR